MVAASVKALDQGGFAVVTGGASRARVPQPGLLARHADKVSGPLAGLAAGYVAHLAGRGYAASSVRQHLGLMADLSAWLGEQGLGPGGLSPSVAGRFAAWAGTRRTYLATARSLAPLLEYLRGAGVLPEPSSGPGDGRALLLAEYRQYLRDERGLAGTTIRDVERRRRLRRRRGLEPGKQPHRQLQRQPQRLRRHHAALPLRLVDQPAGRVLRRKRTTPDLPTRPAPTWAR